MLRRWALLVCFTQLCNTANVSINGWFGIKGELGELQIYFKKIFLHQQKFW